jgi:putative serine protease PepD
MRGRAEALRTIAAAALGGVATALALAVAGVLPGGGAPAAGAGVPAGDAVGAVHRAASPAVAAVSAEGRTGSAFLIDDRGHLVTNAHVVGAAREVEVSIAGRRTGAVVRGVEPSVDVAVIALPSAPGGVDPLPFGDSDAVRVGDPVVAIGSPFGLQGSLSTGVVSGLRRQIDAPNGFAITGVIQTDAALNPGNSGGPLLDMSGRVVGVATQIATEGGRNEGIGFAVPADAARRTAEAIVATGRARLPYLGIVGQDAGDGIRIEQATPAGPALGVLRRDDLLTAVDGEPVRSNGDLARVLAERSPGDAVELGVVRAGGALTLLVTLAVRPPDGP